MDKPVVKELIQGEMNERNIIRELDKLINDRDVQHQVIGDYRLLHTKLGHKGASKRAAKIISELLREAD